MIEWKEQRLGDLLKEKPRNGLYKGSSFLGSGYPYIKMSDLYSLDFINEKSTTELIEVTNDEIDRFGCENGDLLFGRTSLTFEGVGKCSLITKCNNKIVFESNIFRIRPNCNKTSSLFLYYFFKSKIGRDYLKGISSQTAATSIRSSEMVDLILKIPELITQTAIAEILSSLDEKIEVNNKINKELENLAQTLFKQWFIDFEFPNENGEPYKSSGGQLVDTELGEIPKGWELNKIGKLYEVSDFVANGSFASLKENVTILEEPSFAIFLRNTDSKSNFTNQMRYVDEKTYKFLNKSKITGNEICISNVADVGTVFRPPVHLNKPMTLGNNLVLFRSDSPNYFYYYFKYFYGQDQIQSITSGSAQLKFNKTDFRNLTVMEVPKNVISKFESLANDLNNLQFEILGENVKLTNLRDTLLPKILSGELELK